MCLTLTLIQSSTHGHMVQKKKRKTRAHISQTHESKIHNKPREWTDLIKLTARPSPPDEQSQDAQSAEYSQFFVYKLPFFFFFTVLSEFPLLGETFKSQ